MQIVIDIPEILFEKIQNRKADKRTLETVIIRGTPLPKGHGRLIDADRLQEEFKKRHDFYVDAYGGFKNLPINDKSRVDEITASIASVVNAPTIIEADKESEV